MKDDVYERALVCHQLLSLMVEKKEGCLKGHPLHKAMRDLQRTYSGVFPEYLNSLWEDVRTPIHPDAVVQYHSGIIRLKGWFANQLNIKEISNDASEAEDLPYGSEIVGGEYNARDWLNTMEEGVGASEESGVGNSSDEVSSERSSEITDDSL